MPDAIREATLRELISAGSVAAVTATGQHGGFIVSITCGESELLLASARGSTRVFASLNSLAVYLRRLGVSQFEVDSHNYLAGRVRKPRPDRAEALRRTRTSPRQVDLLSGA